MVTRSELEKMTPAERMRHMADLMRCATDAFKKLGDAARLGADLLDPLHLSH